MNESNVRTIFTTISDLRLEAECADTRTSSFIQQYFDATGIKISPGIEFQEQSSANANKFGLEGRVYFNTTGENKKLLEDEGLHVQGPRSSGYLSGQYSYRIDKVALFWLLVNEGHRI